VSEPQTTTELHRTQQNYTEIYANPNSVRICVDPRESNASVVLTVREADHPPNHNESYQQQP